MNGHAPLGDLPDRRRPARHLRPDAATPRHSAGDALRHGIRTLSDRQPPYANSFRRKGTSRGCTEGARQRKTRLGRSGSPIRLRKIWTDRARIEGREWEHPVLFLVRELRTELLPLQPRRRFVSSRARRARARAGRRPPVAAVVPRSTAGGKANGPRDPAVRRRRGRSWTPPSARRARSSGGLPSARAATGT
jgi:hypothetical protein